MKPLVSICIPTYNGAEFIAEALDSALAQTYPNLELVVSDDHSDDGTITIVESYRTKTRIPISIYRHDPKGIGANWNHCVRHAHGDYIKFLFQDDILKPDCISKMMTLMLSASSIGLVYCKRDFIYEAYNEQHLSFIDYYGPLHRYWQDVKVKNGFLSGTCYLKDRQFLNSPKNKIGEPTNVLLKTECFQKVGYFSESLQQALDSDYWYRVMKYYDVGFIDKTLVKFRLHEKQASVLNKNRIIIDKELLYKNYYKDLFWYLHPRNQFKLLKLYHPIIKRLVKIKQKLYAR